MIDSTFKLNGHLYLRKDNMTHFHVCSKKLVEFLASLVIPIGKKTDASIPNAIIRQRLTIPLIRGIYRAEGSIYRRYSKKYKGLTKVYSNLPLIQFRMKLETPVSQIQEELVSLGIVPSRLVEKDGVFTFRTTAQKEIERFFETIKPRYKLHPRSVSL
jgi:intein/homing endonuclease